MKKICIAICLLLFSLIDIHAQEQLTGRLIDSITGKPVVLANVFLSNTSVGTTSGEDGTFSIQSFPAGRFQLVISCIGYETVSMPVRSDQLSTSLLIKLVPKVKELQEVVVQAYDKSGWRKWGALFYEHFIGDDPFSNTCRLINNDALKFRLNKKKDALRVFSDETLVIENKSLGYIIRYALVNFTYNFTTKVFQYEGYPLFEEMPAKTPADKQRWLAKREESYSGSLMQFMRSVFRNRFVEDRFEVRKVLTVSEDERKRVEDIYLRQKEILKKLPYKTIDREVSNEDSAWYYRAVMDHPQSPSIVIDKLIPRDSLTFAVGPTITGMYFTDKIQVTYLRKKNPREFAKKFLESNEIDSPVTSELLIREQPINVLANGSYYNGINLFVFGYWGWSEKLIRMLPYEYHPGNDFRQTSHPEK